MNSDDPARSLEASCERDPRGDRTSRIMWHVRYGDLDQQGKLMGNRMSEAGCQRMYNGHGDDRRGACVTIGRRTVLSTRDAGPLVDGRLIVVMEVGVVTSPFLVKRAKMRLGST